MAAALLHMVGNGLAKSVAFCSTGELLFSTGTTESTEYADCCTSDRSSAPRSGSAWLLCWVCRRSASSPVSWPSCAPASPTGLIWLIAIAIVLMLTIFGAVTVHSLNMLAGRPDVDSTGSPLTGHISTMTSRIPLVGGLLVAAALGVTIWPIARLVHDAAEVLAR